VESSSSRPSAHCEPYIWRGHPFFASRPPSAPPIIKIKLPGIAAEDIGKCAYGIFKKGNEFVGQTVAITDENLTGKQMAAVFTEVMGKEVRYNSVPPEVYRAFGFPGADDLGNMFQFKRDFEDYFCGAPKRLWR
jgi:NmrA-like family